MTLEDLILINLKLMYYESRITKDDIRPLEKYFYWSLIKKIRKELLNETI